MPVDPTMHGFNVETEGADGSAEGEAVKFVSGTLVHIDFEYDASCPSTTDVEILRQVGTEWVRVFLLENNKTRATYSPSLPQHGTDVAVTGNEIPITLSGHVKAKVTGCNALNPAVRVYLTVI